MTCGTTEHYEIFTYQKTTALLLLVCFHFFFNQIILTAKVTIKEFSDVMIFVITV